MCLVNLTVARVGAVTKVVQVSNASETPKPRKNENTKL